MHTFDNSSKATQPQINSAIYQLINTCLCTMGNKGDALPRTANRLKAWCRASLFNECDYGVVKSSDVNDIRATYADTPSPRIIRHFVDDAVSTLSDTLVADGVAKRTATSMVKRLQKAISAARKIDFDKPTPSAKVSRKAKAAPTAKVSRKAKAAPSDDTVITADAWESMTDTTKSEISALIECGAIKLG